MIPNTLKALWAAGRPMINGWCSIGNPFTAEIMAAQGFDSVTIDMQHGALDYSNLLPMFQAMGASGAVLMARVPWLEPRVRIEERVVSDEVPENTCEFLLKHFNAHGTPAAIYNVAGANRRVARALEQAGAAGKTIFVGHELTNISRGLLETGTMDYVISHDFTGELTSAARWIRENIEGVMVGPSLSQILVHTRYNCT